MHTRARDGREITATIDLPDTQTANSFWKTALPRAGYAVTRAQFVVGAGEIRFTGHGCGGNSQIALTFNRAAVQCELT